MAAALKALYYARCGSPEEMPYSGPWRDAICHAEDGRLSVLCRSPMPTPSEHFDYGILDLSGGWHDAGDYEKKIGLGTSCGTLETGDNGDTLWYLLSAYELNPGLFRDLDVGLPESGRGLPDVLAQAKWELDWYLKMQRGDGHVLEGVHVLDLSTLASPPTTRRTIATRRPLARATTTIPAPGIPRCGAR